LWWEEGGEGRRDYMEKTRRQEVPPEAKEKFCQGLARGLSKGHAYKDAGLGVGCKQASIYVYASKLAKEQAVIDRVSEIQKEAKEQAKQNAADDIDLRVWLNDVVAGAIEDRGQQASLRDRLKAAELKARIDGMMVEKREVNGDMVIEVCVNAED
jgi:type II secretory ATPase GspE/PulE/Tfp pilus assembly ATPase PilB-like protein